MAEDGVSCAGTAGHGHHVVLCQVHAFGGAALGALGVVPVHQGQVVPPAQPDFRAHHLGLRVAMLKDEMERRDQRNGQVLT